MGTRECGKSPNGRAWQGQRRWARRLWRVTPFIGLAIIAGGPVPAMSQDTALHDASRLSERQGKHCRRFGNCPTKVRQIGRLDSIIADDILEQVSVVNFTLRQHTPVLLQGKTMSRLTRGHKKELKATYQAGHTIVLLDATMEDVATLQGIVEGGVTYSSKDGERVLAYALRQENHIPTAMLLSNVHLSPLRNSQGDPDPTGLQDEEQAYKRAADLTVNHLRHAPNVGVQPPRDPSRTVDWQTTPVQRTVLVQNGSAGVYNTTVNVYALHSCQPDTRTGLTYDYYMVTALADWTPTNAKFQSAATELGAASMYYDAQNDAFVVANWRDDPQRTYCSSHSYLSNEADICRYINYPLQYEVKMVPLNTGSVVQTNAKPPASQGQSTAYTSGFMFNLGGTVNVSGSGPGAGISAAMTWNNTQSTTVPPLELDLGQADNEGAHWTFKYCTGGEEPDPGASCTSHVQTAKDVCRAQLGDSTGTNPQQGQTPVGAFTDAVQTALWQAGPDTRAGASTFDIEVTVTPLIGYTTVNLWSNYELDRAWRSAGCNQYNCDCVSQTISTPLPGGSYRFKIPLPSTTCQ